MRKLFMIAAITMSLAACSSNPTTDVPNNDSTLVDSTTSTADTLPVSVDTVVIPTDSTTDSL